MALIFRNAAEQTTPKWLDETEKLPISSEALSEDEVLRVASLPKDIDTESLVKELDIIEARGKTGEAYHYSSSWSDETKQMIKDYSIISNCKAIEVNASSEEIQAFASVKREEKGLQKIASSTASPLCPVQDSFMLDVPFSEKDDSPVKEGLKALQKARTGIPSVLAKGVTISRSYSDLDDDTAGLGMRASAGRNVIQDPNSIGRSATSKDEDVGVRLRREKEEKVQAKIAQHIASQKAFEKQMKASGYGASRAGGFRMTEASQVHGGVLKKLNREIPALTQGETIVASRKAKERDLEIKKANAKKQWNHVNSSSKPEISDDLANAIKIELGKVK